ncbi:hypothetical protein V492_03816 [Pseudogymnoascus sp. VKM F-4246]|nr:hypothetical protein V492_03816 [Pseudogymnoascus sp. VKM F-4246]
MADAAGNNREFQDALQRRVHELEGEVAILTAEIGRLLGEREIATDKYGPNCFVRKRRPVDWRKMLRDSGYTRDPKILKTIYRVACKRFNMSSVPQNHGLYYVPPNDEALHLEPVVADPTAGFQQRKFFNFAALLKDHPAIVFKIAVYAMVKDSAISVVARFDVHDVYPPTEGGLDRKSGLSYRFHWGGKACAINSAPLPRDILAPIFVSRDWHEIFASVFYFMNSFSFESLGEFCIFCNNTPRARWQRMTDVSITWIGSIMETSNPRKSGPRWDRSRWGMHRLGLFSNLRSLVICLDETSNGRIRRKDEPEHMKKPLERSTRYHDNYRMTRDLRKLRGMDNIYQLRGIEHIEVYDNYQLSPLAPVRDQSFVQDLKNQVCSSKSKEDVKKAKIKNLMPLLRRRRGTLRYKPSRQVKDVLKLISKSRPRYPRPQFPREMDDDSDCDDSDDSDDEDRGDISDSDDDVDYDQLDNDDQSQSDDSNSDSDSEDGDDAPDHGANALRAASTVSSAGNFGHSGGNNDNDNNDDEDEMDGLEQKNATKPDGDSDDGFEAIQSEKPVEVKDEGDDEIKFIKSVKRSQIIDLTQLEDMEDPDTAFPSVEEDEVKEEMKEENPTGAGSMDAMESIPVFEGRPGLHRGAWSPFGNLSLRRGRTDQSSLFVRQSPSSRRSFSSHFLTSFGRPSYERKRSIDGDDDDDDMVARASSRRRLSSKEFDDEEMEE